MIRAGLRTVPAPPADALCATLLDGPINTCSLGAIIEWGLASTTQRAPRCNAGGQVDPPGAPAPLADLRPLPPGAFENATELLAAEGATYFW